MTVTDPTNTVTQQNTYDNRGRVVETVNAKEEFSTGKVKYEYDILDRVTDKKVYDLEYPTDEKGNIIANSTPWEVLVNHESYEYIDCAEFTVGSETFLGYAEIKKTYTDNDEVKETYTSVYDKFGRLRAEKVGDTTLKTYEYNHLNQLISEHGDGLNLAYTYAWNGEVETIARTIGTDTYTESNVYNALGQLASYRDYDGYAGNYDTVIYDYDYLGNVTNQQTAFDVIDDTVIYTETVNTYDFNGNVTTTEIKNNAPTASASYVETTYTYDNLNRPVKATSGNIVTTYTYDDLGNISTQKTGDSQTTYTYNNLGQLCVKEDALGQKEFYEYDGNGFLKAKTDRNGTKFTYTYNALGNVLTENAIGTDSSTNTRTSTYSKTGELKSVTENGKTLSYEYDSKGLLTKVTDNSAGSVQNYTYDNYGKLTNYTLSLNGTQQINTAYTYDDAARLHTVKEDNVTQAVYTYNPDSTIQSELIGNGVTTSYNYNTANLVTNVSSKKGNTLLAGYTYGYLLDGNIVTKSDNTGITTDYVYNNAGMLTFETVSSLSEELQNTAYSYDNRGNRIGAIGTGYDNYTESYEYDSNNRLTNLSKVVYNEYDHPDNIFSTWYNYDFNGNLFSENVSAIRKSLDNPSITMNVFGTGDDNWNHEVGLTIYNYNLNNQLVNVAKDGKTATYTYNPDGYRSSKTVDGITTNHIWNGTQIVLETDASDDILAKYVYGNRRIYNEQDNVKSYYLYDAHGDTKHLTNATGGITWDYTYDAFGNEVELENIIPSTSTTITEPYNPFRYCGEYYDSETGFIYLRARYYSPEIGRFVSEDPAFDGVNWYTYCVNNPIIYHDPDGKNPLLLILSSPVVQQGLQATSTWLSNASTSLQIFISQYLPVVQQAVNDVGQVAPAVGEKIATLANSGYGNQVEQAATASDNNSGSSNSQNNHSSNNQSSTSPNGDPNNWNHRDYYMNQVENKKLRNAINQLYREPAEIGDGGTADMLRYEFQNGQPLRHLQKANDMITHLNNILTTQSLSETEIKITYELLNDLYDAIKLVS